MFLPMSCTSPFTVASTIFPCVRGAPPFRQIRLEVLRDDELPGVDDAHVEAGGDRVVEERGVHGLADDVVAAEREAEVRDPAARLGARAALLDQGQRLDEGLGEL